jgi:hypothetical protein
VSLRAMAGVQRVTLSNSSRASDDGQGTSDSAQSSRGGCGTGPQFSLTIFFEAKAASATAAAGGTTP